MSWSENDQEPDQRGDTATTAADELGDHQDDPGPGSTSVPFDQSASGRTGNQRASKRKRRERQSERERPSEPPPFDEFVDRAINVWLGGPTDAEGVANAKEAAARPVPPPFARADSGPAERAPTAPLAAVGDDAHDLMAAVDDLANEMLTLRTDVAESRATSHTNHNDLSTGLSGVWAELSTVSAKVDELSALRTDLSAVRAKILDPSVLQAQLAAMMAKVDSLPVLRDDISAVSARVDQLFTLRADIIGVASQVDALSSLRGDLSGVAAQVDELSTLRRDLSGVAVQVDELSTLRRDISGVAAQVDELSTLRRDLSGVAAQVDQLATLRDEMAGVGAQVEELAALRAELVTKVVELSGVRTEVASLAALVEELINDGLDTRFAETGARLVGDLDAQLATRILRFEALSQAMMTLVGEPVEALTGKMKDVARTERSNRDIERSIAEITESQVQLAAAISALHQDGLERDAQLNRVLDKLDRLTEPT